MLWLLSFHALLCTINTRAIKLKGGIERALKNPPIISVGAALCYVIAVKRKSHTYQVALFNGKVKNVEGTKSSIKIEVGLSFVVVMAVAIDCLIKLKGRVLILLLQYVKAISIYKLYDIRADRL